MTNTLAGTRAVVTGSARGIGRAEALALAAAGAIVVVNFSRSADAADEVVKTIEQGGGTAHAVGADLSDPHAAADLMTQAAQLMGGIDVLVSNAGVEHFGDLGSVTAEDFDRVFALNTRGQFLAVQEVQRHMSDNGRIVCTSSVSARTPFPRHAVYSASKAAIEGMVACLALDLAERRITINAIAPGGTNSDMASQYGSDYDTRYAGAIMPMGRFGEPAEIADVVTFLASPAAGWITGQTIRVSGGQ